MALQATDYSYVVKGTREDLSDLISNISPTDVPFTKMCRKGKADNTYFEWQIDSLATAATNAQLEGDVAPSAVFGATTRVGNYTQISAKTVDVSGTVQATLKAGRGKDELAYQITKKTKELKRDIEVVLVQGGVSNAGNSTTARETRGLECIIDTNNVSTGTGSSPGNAITNVARTAATAAQAAVTEANLKSVLQSCFSAGGVPDVLMMDPVTRQAFSAFTAVGTRYQDPSSNRNILVNTISVYESDFGSLKAVANRFMPTTTNGKSMYALQSDMWEIAYLRPFDIKDIAATGDYTRKEILVEYGLKFDNNAAHGAVKDIA